MHFDCLVVGAGFAGAVMAERLASQLGKNVLVVDRRDHIAGNAFDAPDRQSGVLLHRYGPHYFRTNSPRIREYLSQFTEWRPTDYKILAWSDGRFWPFPVNLNTFEQLIGRPSTSEEMAETLEKWRVPLPDGPRPRQQRGSHRQPDRRGAVREVFQGVHPQTMAARSQRAGPERLRPDSHPHQPRRPLPERKFPGVAARRLHAALRASARASPHRSAPADRFPRRRARRCPSIIWFTPVPSTSISITALGPLPYRSLRFEPETLDAAMVPAHRAGQLSERF